ncbi:MAG: two-component system regulatory protein YycI [Weissella confusa]|nr:two-component system regulatory protein YycI [Weissella confusa]
MDFKKILATFLVVFVAIDVFLAFQWFQIHQPTANPTATESILSEMKSDGIQVGNLDTDSETGAYIGGQDGNDFLKANMDSLDKRWSTKLTGNQLTATLDKPVFMGTSRSDVRKSLQKLVNDKTQVIAGTQYVYDAKLTEYANNDSDNSAMVVYTQKMTNRRQFMTSRGQIRFLLDKNHDLKGYTQTYVSNAQVLRDSTTLISEEKALIGAYQYNEIPNNGKLNWSHMGYAPLTTVGDDTIFVPAWIFSVTDGTGNTTLLRINALNGALMK